MPPLTTAAPLKGTVGKVGSECMGQWVMLTALPYVFVNWQLIGAGLLYRRPARL